MSDNFARKEYGQSYEYRPYVPYSERKGDAKAEKATFSRSINSINNSILEPKMEPERRKSPAREEKSRVRIEKNSKPKVGKHKKAQGIKIDGKAVARFALLGCLMFGLILLTAVTASVKFSAGEIKSQNAEIQSQIDYHNVQLETATNAKKVEEYALKNLGMVFVDDSNEVVLGESTDETAEQAKILE